jgi:hypothetical protein
MILKDKIKNSIWRLAIYFIFAPVKNKFEEGISLPLTYEIDSISVDVWQKSHMLIVHNIERKLRSYDFKRKY